MDDENLDLLLILRPRKFGKSLNISMLYSFLIPVNAEINKTLFEGLKIMNKSNEKYVT